MNLKTQPIAVVIILIIALSCSQCAYVFKNKIPMPQVYHKLSVEKRQPTLIIFLPGIFSGPRYFVSKGIISDLRSSLLQADAVALDAHSGYYRDKSLFPRLMQDVIRPARQAGYEMIWLVGVSLGGLGALLFAQEHPHSIDGVIALAPYLGDKELCQEIKQAGGLRDWKPLTPLDADDRYRSVLLWMKQHCAAPRTKPVIYLGYGTKDRFRPLLDLVAEIFPPEQVITLPGGHFWKTWRKIFNKYLEKGIFKTRDALHIEIQSDSEKD
ncbi:alpha/beta fold hydrolase [candidate division CSSED10-310 bacterium]|uniref:Alpha/beta fold hydrolase n=1 Tax=candidate division CSSED10-310 bacterium TaxID=2855610 RepID=A0ABV6YZW1_UNCC1